MFRKLSAVMLLAVLLGVLGISPGSAAEEFAPGEVLVVLKAPNAATAETRANYASKVAQDIGGYTAQTYNALSQASGNIFSLVRSGTVTEQEMMAQLKQRPDVLSVSLNHRNYVYDDGIIPNDTQFTKLWGMPAVRAPEAWTQETGSANVYAVVIDSGIDYTHPDIATNFETEGLSASFASGKSASDYGDEHGHGTHVAGTIGAAGNNGMGVAGVNWNTRLISLRIFDESGSCWDSEIINALNGLLEILNNHPDMRIASVNMSYGNGVSSETPEERLDTPYYMAMKAVDDTNRVIMCVAAGNEGTKIGDGMYTYPASFTGLNNMIVVANAQNDSRYSRASTSNYSTEHVDIAAPGTDVWSTAPNESTLNSYYPGQIITENGYKYLRISGTSMATPHVAGAVALLASAVPDADSAQIRRAILEGANTDYATNYTKHGFLDVKAALDILQSENAPNTPPVILTSNLSEGMINTAYSVRLAAKGTKPITWRLESGRLPAGLTMDSEGKISGTPTASGSYNFTVRAENPISYTTKSLSLNIDQGVPLIVGDTMPDGSIENLYSERIQLKGLQPITCTLYGGTLPPGFTLESDGTIKGAYSKPGTWRFYVQVSNSVGSSQTMMNLTIKGIKPTVLDYYIPNAARGKPYSQKLEAIGTAPVTWSLEGGALPEGLTLNSSTGIISGTAKIAGTYQFYAKAENAYGSDKYHINICVDEPDTSSDITITTESILPTACRDVPYSVKLEAQGTAPITWSIEEGGLPDGFSLGEDGVISGRWTKNWGSSARFKVKASNRTGSVSKYFAFHYSLKETDTEILLEELPDGLVGESYSRIIDMTGYSPVIGDIVDGELPPGMILERFDWYYWLTLKGTPLQAGTYTFTVRLAWAGGSDFYDKKQYTLTIRDKPVKPVITTEKLPEGRVGIPYSGHVYASGTMPRIMLNDFSVPGFSYWYSLGWFHGTPTQAGEYRFSATASNSEGADTKDFTLIIRSYEDDTPPDGDGVAIDAEHFHDGIFREYVRSSFDKNGDGKLSPEEIAAATSISVEEKGITSLKGVEYFTALITLYCGHNQLTELYLSNNTVLKELACWGNQLTELDVSKNTALEYLSCNYNQLSRLDLQNNTALKYLDCAGNPLGQLDVSKNTALMELSCYENFLSELDLSHNTELISLTCSNNGLGKLDLSHNIYLTYVYLSFNLVSKLDVSKNTLLTSLGCSGNKLTELDVSHSTALTYLDCSRNQLTELDVSHNTALEYLYCYSNQLTLIYVYGCTSLTRDNIHCDDDTLIIDYELTPPQFTAASFPTGRTGQPYSASFSASGAAPITYGISSNGKEYGLSCDPATGQVTGTLTASNSFTLTLFATNYAGTASKDVTVKVSSGGGGGDDIIAPIIDIPMPPEFNPGHALVLDGQIGVIFYVKLPEDPGINYNDKNCWMEFDIRGDKSNNPQPLDTRSRLNFTDADGIRNYAFVCYINSAQMADTITATLHYGDNESISQESSADAYLTGMMDKFTGVVHDLMVAIKDYGHYVQPMLANANGWKIGELFLEMTGVNVYTAQDIENVRIASAPYAIVRNTGSSLISSVGFALKLGSTTSILLYLNVPSGYTGNVAAYLEGSSQNIAVKKSATQYLVELNDIPAHELHKTHRITVKAGSSFEVRVSALSYVNTMLNRNDVGMDIKEAVTALYKYWEAAMKYRAASGS